MIVGVDLNPGRKAMAEKFGMTHFVNPKEAEGDLVPLGRIRQKGGKYVEAFALEGDLDPAAISSNPFTLEWPPRSARFKTFPEIDRAAWFALAEAREKILRSQAPLLDLLEAALS